MPHTLQEVLKLPAVLSGELWFRPLSWHGQGCAFRVNGGNVYRAYAWDVGSEPDMTFSVEALTDQWGVVRQEVVVSESHAAIGTQGVGLPHPHDASPLTDIRLQDAPEGCA